MDQRWIKGATTIDRFQYGYDRDGNRLWRDNLVNAAFGELYTYDGLNRLTNMQRGTLNAGKTALTGAASRSQAWTLDATGNWGGLTTDGTAQARTNDKQNRVTQVGATNITYDANGSITLDDNGKTLRYDAWGQQVEAKVGSTSYAVYRYDALGRQIERGGYKRHFSDNWQILYATGLLGGVPQAHDHVWSPVYVDAMVFHDWDDGANGSVEARWYPSADANYNVTSVTDRTGAVLEREVYDAYGKIGYLPPDFSARASSSIQTFVWGYQGLRLDGATGAWHARNRELSPTLGRFTRQDPIGYADGANLYQFVRGRPTNRTDPSGLLVGAPPVAPPVIVISPGPALVIGGCVYIIDALGKFKQAYCDTTSAAAACRADFNKPVPETFESCRAKCHAGYDEREAECFKFPKGSPERIKCF